MVLEVVKGKKIYILHKVSPLDIALSIRHLSIMLRTGLAIEDALKVMADQAIDEKLKEAYEEILLDVRSGMNLADAMRKHEDIFSEIIISIISIGEQGATLEKNLLFLADYLKKNFELQRKVKGALVYPMIVLAITVLEMTGVIFFILPQLEQLFASFENKSEFTVFVLNFAGFIRANGIAILGGAVILILIIMRLLKTEPGKRFKDSLGLKIPVMKTLAMNNMLTQFSRTLGILLESGMPIQTALKITADTVENYKYQLAIKDVYEGIKSGHNLADTLSTYPKYFPGTFVKMIDVGEQTGSLEENLNYLYDFYSEEVQEMSSNLTTLLEPLLLVFIGAMIGLLALFIIMPIYQLTGSIRG
ncbi:MAG: Type II secretion system protein F [candidate division WS6 bacterium OLB20]|uniref:Type II secretion system protein F n=1 Tax=candidate division WS6 bacterium OLB20 TaxID=1617426 RepID=A0A136M0K9_9BACT|nr:MAG: Type II secretion system protein F [candidate division WS6 bacterium OLB20]